VEFVMSGNQSNRTWQAQLVARHPGLFNQEINGPVIAPGYPMVGDGWRDFVETAIGRIASAVAAVPAGSLKIGQIKEKFATLRVYLDGSKRLPESTNAAIDEAIDLAEARSACTAVVHGRACMLTALARRQVMVGAALGDDPTPDVVEVLTRAASMKPTTED
jgi:hypothetical protein